MLLDDSGDLLVRGGLAVGDTDYQRCRMVILAQKGEFKGRPALGFGIDRWLKSAGADRQKFTAELTKELRSDGMSNARVRLTGNGIAEFEVEV